MAKAGIDWQSQYAPSCGTVDAFVSQLPTDWFKYDAKQRRLTLLRTTPSLKPVPAPTAGSAAAGSAAGASGSPAPAPAPAAGGGAAAASAAR